MNLDMVFISLHAKFQLSRYTIVNVAAYSVIIRLGLRFIMKLAALLGKAPCIPVRGGRGVTIARHWAQISCDGST